MCLKFRTECFTEMKRFQRLKVQRFDNEKIRATIIHRILSASTMCWFEANFPENEPNQDKTPHDYKHKQRHKQVHTHTHTLTAPGQTSFMGVYLCLCTTEVTQPTAVWNPWWRLQLLTVVRKGRPYCCFCFPLLLHLLVIPHLSFPQTVELFTSGV